MGEAVEHDDGSVTIRPGTAVSGGEALETDTRKEFLLTLRDRTGKEIRQPVPEGEPVAIKDQSGNAVAELKIEELENEEDN